MRTRNSDSATPKKTPPARKAAAKTAVESPATKRTSTVKTRQINRKDASPASNTIPDSNSEKSADSSKKRARGRPRKTVSTPKLVEKLEAVADETAVVDDSGAVEKLEEPLDVELVDASNTDSKEVGERSVGCIGQSKEEEQKHMGVDGPKPMDNPKRTNKSVGCELADKVNAVEVKVTASHDTSSFLKCPETIVDLNISVDDEDAIDQDEGERGEEELKEQEGERGEEELKEQEGERGEEELKEQEGERGEEELKEQEGERGEEQLKEQEGLKGDEDMKEQEREQREELKGHDGGKGEEELKEFEIEKGQVLKKQEADKELQELEGEKELQEQQGENKKKELKEQDGDGGEEALDELGRDKRKEEFIHEGEKAMEERKEEEGNITGHKENSIIESFNAGDHLQKDVNPRKDSDQGTMSSSKHDHGEQGGEHHFKEDPEEDPKETEAQEEEHMELEAIAKQQKIKKEHEIFVGGLDRDATEEDLRKAFQRIGEVVEVRLHKNSSTNKNKGYAFVKFANKEHAKRALSEMKNPVICGKRCGTAPSEDNDTLYLGNICNTWTKEAIKRKLKDYGIEEIENITLVPNVQNAGLSRGFAFLEFSCHADAMIAYKRLQKPDAIFGHPERSAKVAFAEPMREPDPDIMAQVKSVFVNGIPSHWDEDHVKELFKSYGEIVRIVLARNMPTAKRKDYGFVDFSTHEAAVACVEAVNKSDLFDGASKIKVRARLSNPLPKTQAVKGGMFGGFRIGHAHTRIGPVARSGRGFGRGRQPFNNWGNMNRDRNLCYDRHRQFGRMSFWNEPDFNMYPDFHHRHFSPQGVVGGGHHPSSRGAAFAGPYHDREWYGIRSEGPSEPFPSRRPYSPAGQFDRPHMGRHFDDPYFYDENMHGMKRPFHMTEPDPDFMGPNRQRPRLDYPDTSSFQENHYHGSFGSGSRQYLHDYYGSDYAGGPYKPFYGGDNSHGHGHY